MESLFDLPEPTTKPERPTCAACGHRPAMPRLSTCQECAAAGYDPLRLPLSADSTPQPVNAQPLELEHQAATDVAGYSFERPHADHVPCPNCHRSYHPRATWLREGRPSCYAAECTNADALAAFAAWDGEPF